MPWGADRETRARITPLAELLRSFATITTDTSLLLDTVVSRSAHFFGASCTVRLLSDDRTRLETVALCDPVHDPLLPALVTAPMILNPGTRIAEALRTGEAYALTERVSDEVTTPFAPEMHEAVRALAVRGVLVAPMRGRDAVMGAFFVLRRGETTLPFDAIDLELATAVASHAALALANALAVGELSAARIERTRAEVSLVESEAARTYAQRIVDSIAQPLVVLDVDGRVESANRAFFSLAGSEPAVALGARWDEVAGSALDHEPLRDLLRQAGESPGEVSLDLVFPGRERRSFVLTARTMPPLLPAPRDESRTAILLVLEDVTPRLEHAAMIARRALLLEALSDAVLAGDTLFRITECNPAAERLLGRTLAEMRGRHVEDVFAVAGIDRERERDRVRAGLSVRHRMKVQHRSGTWVDVELSTMPVTHGGAMTGFVCVMRDITEHLALERAADVQLAALRQANEELEGFTYSVSHDLRTPVRAIEGFSRLLEEGYAAAFDAEGRRLLGIVRRNARKMGTLIDDLLAFSRLGRKPVVAEDVDMTELAREVTGEICRLEPDRVYEVTIADALPHVLGDRGLVRQVWENLVANAVKYTRGRSPARIAIRGEFLEGEAIFRIEDNGVGFDMRYADKLFGVFERLHPDSEFEGTGVGLALVDRIVRKHGGRIWADSVVGAGTTFHFSMPRSEDDRS